ncbi:hypothetical protein BDF19DRAFT_417791 [Syncephalis fuscata]|nr:hypothetical protein BDF19DRAFT_417791 [Syncephalis fuscata]
MTDSSESKPSSSGDETVYLGPFGNVTKPVAIGIGVAFGIIAIGVAYAIIRRVFPGKSNGTIVRTPNPATHYTNTIPMESRGNDKDGDPGAAYGAGSGPNGTSNSGGLRNNIRQSRLWNAMGGAAASLGNSSNGRQRKGRDDGYTNVQDFNEKEINMNRAATMSPVEAVVVKDIAEIMPLKTSTRNANPTAMMTSVVVDLGVEPSATRDNQTSTGSSQPVSRSASRAASRKSSVHRSGTARRANTFGHSAAHKSQTSLGQTANEHSDAGKSVSRQPSTHRLHSDKHAVVSRSSTVTGKSIPVDSPMRRSKSSSKVGAKPAGGSTHRRTASSHDNQSRRSSSSQRKTPKLAEDEPSLPNNFDLALLSKKLKQQEQAQRRYPANDQDSTPIGVLHKRSLSATPQLKVH